MTTTQWKGSASTSTVAASTDWKPWADKISGSWQKATRSIIETGQDLIDAQANLTRDSFEAMLKQGLPMDYTTATRLMAIARQLRCELRRVRLAGARGSGNSPCVNP